MLHKIEISTETKMLIRTFGSTQESYDTIIKRIYKLAVKQQIRDFLLSSKNCISIDEAIRRTKEKYKINRTQ